MPALKHPLEGIRVIDLGRHQAGPRCAQVLARMGAEVIKVERLGGEETRYHGPWVKKQSSYWVQYNSGKKSLAMDLRKEEGKEALRKLVKVSDVLVQNFDRTQSGEQALNDVRLEEVTLAMRDLTDLQQQVLNLRFAADLSIAEVAKVMSRKEGAVKFLQFSALRALRRVWSQQEAGSHGN